MLPTEDTHFVGYEIPQCWGAQRGYDWRKGNGLDAHLRFCAHTSPSSPIRNYQKASESGI